MHSPRPAAALSVAAAVAVSLLALLCAPANAALSNKALVGADAPWRYLANGGTPSSGWVATSYNDGTWRTGPAELGAGDGGEATVINRSAPWHTTDYFRTKFSVTDRTKVNALTLKLLADDGAVVWLNGTRVVVDNMNAKLTTAATTREGTAESTWRAFTVPTAPLVNGTNTLAVAVYQTNAFDRDVSFAASLVAQVTIADPTTTTTLAPVPDETAAFQALLDGAAPGSTVTVDRAWQLAGTATIRKPLVLSFTATGLLYRPGPVATVRVLPVLVLGPEASGSRLDGLRIQGPSGCNYRYPTGSDTFINGYDATIEAHHGVDIRGASDVTLNAPLIDGMDGDGINIVNNARNITVNDATIRCVGRNAISNTGSTNTVVNRGSFSGAGLWVFNIEPFTTNVVDTYTVTGARVGMSGGPWLFADGPDFNCQVFNVRFSSTDLSGTSPTAPAPAACVAAQITVG